MPSGVLYLLDFSSYIYRAFHAIRGLTTSQGFLTNAAFGVTNMLLKVLRERQPQYLVLAFDSKAPTFRHREYSEYKAHRPPMPEELALQLPYIQKIIQGLNLPRLEMEGFEARAVQHEVDHLDGLLFVDRLVSRRTDLFQRKVYRKGGKGRS